MNLPRAIACLPKWADDEPSRYKLECVRIKSDGMTVFAEATDGRRLCRLTWNADGKEAEYHFPRTALSKALRAVGMAPDGYFATQATADWSSPSSPFTGVRYTGKIPALVVYGKNCGQTLPTEEVKRWPKTEDVLHPPAKATASTVNVRELRDQARVVIKEKVFSPPQMHLTLSGVKVTLDAKYVRDMAETAIQCGYDEVHVSAADKQSAVHFWAYTDVKFESAIMPLAAD